MSDLAKITLPFLDSRLVKEDYSPESGFVNMYLGDTDHPTYYKELYLMYDDSVRTQQSIETARKLNSLNTVIHVSSRTINNKNYIIYQFFTDSDIKKLLGSYVNLNAKEKIKIIKFWNNYDEVFEKLLSNSILGFEGNLSIPPADYNGSYSEYIENNLIV